MEAHSAAAGTSRQISRSCPPPWRRVCKLVPHCSTRGRGSEGALYDSLTVVAATRITPPNSTSRCGVSPSIGDKPKVCLFLSRPVRDGVDTLFPCQVRSRARAGAAFCAAGFLRRGMFLFARGLIWCAPLSAFTRRHSYILFQHASPRHPERVARATTTQLHDTGGGPAKVGVEFTQERSPRGRLFCRERFRVCARRTLYAAFASLFIC